MGNNNKEALRYINEDDNLSPFKTIISIFFLQIKVGEDDIFIYFLSSETLPDVIDFSVTFTIYILNEQVEPKEFTLVARKSGYEKNNIYYYDIEIFYDEDLSALFEVKGNNNIRVVINKFEINNKDEENFDELYQLDLHLGKYADSQKQPNIDFSTIIHNYFDYYYEDIDYNTKTYKIKEISSCSKNYEFNLTVDKNIDINEKINLIFIGTNGIKNYTINPECKLLSKLNNIITCQLDDETKDLIYTINDFINIGSNQLLAIFTQNNVTFSLYCYEKPPIAGIIAIIGMFLFSFIIVIIIILYLNKNGIRSNKNNSPDKYNVINNSVRISSGQVSK